MPIHMMNPFLAVNAPTPATLTRTYIGTASNGGTTESSHTFTSQGIGTAADDRVVLVVLHVEGVDVDPTPGTITCSIGGNAATLSCEALNTGSSGGGTNSYVGHFYLAVPAAGGTAADIAVNYGQSAHAIAIHVYNINGDAAAAHTDTFVNNTAGTGGSIDVDAGGVYVASTSTTTFSTPAWTGPTLDHGAFTDGQYLSTASDDTEGAAQSFSATNASCMCATAFAA